ncbi:MAG: hypothetical protein HS127_19000 [Planctomycetia bacterium]|nr:hypothetical protein [Planctomycetia bacterium]
MEIARLGWTGGDDYNLAYFRHTGKWQDCLSGTLDECLQAIKDNEFGLFWIFNLNCLTNPNGFDW